MTVVPPYRQIADEVRRRVDTGLLRPGDRVPSTRQIAREFEVAIATATKALTLLRQEGITVARPGVGTMVAPPRVRPAGGDLSRDRIVRTAMALADAEGLTELSMRRVASDLGVATMSVYRHVPGKDELLILMIDAALGEQQLPAGRAPDWRTGLTRCAALLWRAFRRHPWLAPAMSLTRPQPAPNGLRFVEWVLDALSGTRLSRHERLYVHIMLVSFVRGVASALEPEAAAVRETGLSAGEWLETQESPVETLTLPHLRELADADTFDLDLDFLVRFGLARLLDGLHVYVDGPG